MPDITNSGRAGCYPTGSAQLTLRLG